MFFDDAALCVGAVEHRHLAPVACVALVQPRQLGGDEARLVVLVVGVITHDLVAGTDLGPQLLRLALDVVHDHGVGRIEDGLRAAVVLGEDHRVHVGEGPLELQDVAEVGPAEAVHRLVRVADDAHVVVFLADEQHDLVLRDVGVLVLVDENVFEAVLVRGEHTRMLAEQRDDVDEKIIEVHGTGTLQAVLVLGIHLRVLLLERTERVVVRPYRRHELVLPQADPRLCGARGVPLRVEVEVANDVADEPLRIGRVVNGERARIPEFVGVAAQDPYARCVERADPHLVGNFTDEAAHAAAHLFGRLVREGDREDVHRVNAASDEVGDAVREHTGLARTRSGNDEQRSAVVFDCVALIGVELREVE